MGGITDKHSAYPEFTRFDKKAKEHAVFSRC